MSDITKKINELEGFLPSLKKNKQEEERNIRKNLRSTTSEGKKAEFKSKLSRNKRHKKLKQMEKDTKKEIRRLGSAQTRIEIFIVEDVDPLIKDMNKLLKDFV